MNEEKVRRLVRRFAVAARAHYEAVEGMDEVSAARQAVMVMELFGVIVREGTPGREALLDLLNDHDDAVAGMAAIYSMRYAPERSLVVLRRIAAEPGLLGFRAAVAIERWEAGEWEID